jgi:hypothetical protein
MTFFLLQAESTVDSMIPQLWATQEGDKCLLYWGHRKKYHVINPFHFSLVLLGFPHQGTSLYSTYSSRAVHTDAGNGTLSLVTRALG